MPIGSSEIHFCLCSKRPSLVSLWEFLYFAEGELIGYKQEINQIEETKIRKKKY